MDRKKSSESMNFEEMLKYIEDHKHIMIKKLLACSFEKLYEREKYYNDWAKKAEESGFSESAELNHLHASVVSDAIVLKRLMNI